MDNNFKGQKRKRANVLKDKRKKGQRDKQNC